MGDWRLVSVFSNLRERLAAERSWLRVPAAKWHVHPHQRPVLSELQTSQRTALRGTPLPHCVGGLRMVQGLSSSQQELFKDATSWRADFALALVKESTLSLLALKTA